VNKRIDPIRDQFFTLISGHFNILYSSIGILVILQILRASHLVKCHYKDMICIFHDFLIGIIEEIA